MTIYIIRASHANQYELQNYEPLIKNHDIKLISSKNPLTSTKIPTIKLWSPTDLPLFPYRKQILNRLIGGEQWLLGLENMVSQRDILHTAETYTPYTHQAVMLRKNKRIKKLICTCWETIPHNNEKFNRLKLWKKDSYKYVDIFHTPTQRAKDALIKEGVNPNKIKVIKYGVDLNRFSARPHAPKSKSVVLTVARKVEEKGLKIWNRLNAELGESLDFKWLDAVPYESIASEYKKADIFLLPSIKTKTWEEQYGMALVEAMAAGLPIVTTNTGAIPEVTGNTAIHCDPNYASVKNKLLKLSSSRALLAKYQKLTRLRAVEYFDSLKQSRLLSELY